MTGRVDRIIADLKYDLQWPAGSQEATDLMLAERKALMLLVEARERYRLACLARDVKDHVKYG